MKKYPNAIIIGAGAAGLACVSALSELCEHVTIIEKDAEPDGVNARKGTAQGGHLHSVLLGGLALLDTFYPNIKEKLKQAGAITFKAGLNQHIYESLRWLPTRELPLEIVSQSRPLLEHTILTEAKKITNVNWRYQTKVDDIHHAENAVTGVTVSSAHGVEKIDAPLVIDATGVSAVFVKRLSAHYPGLDQHDSVNSKIAYASAVLKKPEAWLKSKENVLLVPEPTQDCGGALLDIEDDRWVVSIHGRHGVTPPTDFEQWKTFIKNLPQDAIWQRVKDAELIGKIKVFKKPVSTFRRYDKCENVPVGYFPVGDTISSVNPIFGQGMTVAWGHVTALKDTLEKTPSLKKAQQDYIQRANFWSDRAWRRAAFYDTLFEKAANGQEKQLAIFQKIASSKLDKINDDASEHLELAKKAHMLDAVEEYYAKEWA